MEQRHLLGNDFQDTPSMQELLEVSENINKKFKRPLLDDALTGDSCKTLPCQELLEVSHNISLYYAPRIILNKQQLTTLVVDPQHLYIYWNIDGQSSNFLAQSLLNEDIILRVYAHSERLNRSEKQLVVEKTVCDFQSEQFLNLPLPSQQHDYSACLEINNKKQCDVLLESNHTLSKQATVGNIPCIQSGVLNKNEDHDGVDTFIKKHYASHNCSGQN